MYPRRKTDFFFFTFCFSLTVYRVRPRARTTGNDILLRSVCVACARDRRTGARHALVCHSGPCFSRKQITSPKRRSVTRKTWWRARSHAASPRAGRARRGFCGISETCPTGTVRRLRAITRRNVFETRRLTTVRYFPATDPFGEGERRG